MNHSNSRDYKAVLTQKLLKRHLSLCIRRLKLVSILALSIITFSSEVLASGAYRASGGSANQQYNSGKKVAYQKVFCNQCPLASKKLNTSSAQSIIADIKANGKLSKSLNSREQQALIVYLQRRFRL